MQRLYKEHTSKQLVHTPSLPDDVVQVHRHTHSAVQRVESSHRSPELTAAAHGCENSSAESNADVQSAGRLIVSYRKTLHVTFSIM